MWTATQQHPRCRVSRGASTLTSVAWKQPPEDTWRVSFIRLPTFIKPYNFQLSPLLHTFMRYMLMLLFASLLCKFLALYLRSICWCFYFPVNLKLQGSMLKVPFSAFFFFFSMIMIDTHNWAASCSSFWVFKYVSYLVIWLTILVFYLFCLF